MKIGSVWFVGDRIDADLKDRNIELSVRPDFIDLLRKTWTFEIWRKGTRRLTVKLVPKQLTPEAYAAKCLVLPASILEQDTSNALFRLEPGKLPRPLSFLGDLSLKPLISNPFDVYDRTPGSAAFRITVGRDGLVKQCDLVAQRGKLPSRASACDRLRYHARFYPATDDKGEPVEAETQFTVEWGRSD